MLFPAGFHQNCQILAILINSGLREMATFFVFFLNNDLLDLAFGPWSSPIIMPADLKSLSSPLSEVMEVVRLKDKKKCLYEYHRPVKVF